MRSIGGSLTTAGLLQLLLVGSGIVVARSLGAEDRGYLALLVVVSGVATLLGSLGIFSAVTYYIARDPAHARGVVASLTKTGAVQVAATLALQAIALFAIVHDDPRRVQVAALISLLLTPGIFAYGFGEAILLGQQRFRAFNVFRAVPTATYMALVLLAFVLGAANLVVVMSIWAGANLVGGFLTLAVAIHGLPPALRTGDALASRRTITVFGLKSLIGSLSPIEAFRADQAIVGLFLSPVALGIYVVAQAFTNLPRIVASSIGYIAYPRVAARTDRGQGKRLLWTYFLISIAVCGALVGVLELAAGRLTEIFFGDEFSAAVPIARILLLGTFFSAVRRVLTDGMRGLGYPALGTVAEVASWVVLVPAAALLLPRAGATGIAVALTVAWAASLVLALVLAAAAGMTRLDPIAFGAGGVQRRLYRVVEPALVLPVVAAAAVAVVGGTAVARLSGRNSLLLVAAVVALLVLGFGRSVVTRRIQLTLERARADRGVSPGTRSPTNRRPEHFRLARALYYLGVGSLALLTVRVSGQVTVSDVLFLFSMIVAAAEIVVLRRSVSVRLPILLLVGMGVFSVGGFLSTFDSYAAIKSGAVVARLIFLTIFWFWLGTIVLSRSEHVRKAVGLWATSAAICGSGAVMQLVAGDVIPNTHPVYGRSTGFTGQPNDLGGLCAIAFVPALMLATRIELSAPRRACAYVVLLLVASGLILSGSMGALIAAVAAIFVWFALQTSPRRSLAAFGALIMAVLLITSMQAVRGAPTPLQRFHRVSGSTPGAAGTGSIESRIATYRVATKAIEHDPFVGVGLDLVSITKPFGIVSYEYDVHNIVIGTWYKAGILGMIGMLLALYAVLRIGWRTLLRCRSEAEHMQVVALISSFIAFVVFAMGAPVLFTRYGWIPAGLLLATSAVQLSESGLAPLRPGRSVRSDAVPPMRSLRPVPIGLGGLDDV